MSRSFNQPIITLSLICESVFYYIFSFAMFIFLVMDKLVYEEKNRFIRIDDFLNAPSEIILTGVLVGLLFGIYPIIRAYIVSMFSRS